MGMGRKIIHVDMDEFFARVEQLRHPELMGKPVVVGGDGDPSKRGVVSTASYEARKYGIHSAMPLRTAYRLCPKATFLAVDIPAYQDVSVRIMSILKEYTPLVEPVGFDEAFLDVTHSVRSARTIGKEIKRRIKDELNLVATVGIAPCKLVAKIASSESKPDGFTVIEEADVGVFLKDLPVRALWGVGPKTEGKLRKAGIRTIEELRRKRLEELTAICGESFGRMLFNYSRGLDRSPVVTSRELKSIGREVTFQTDTSDVEFLRNTISELSRSVASQLRSHGYRGRTVTLKIRYQNFSTHTRSVTSPESMNTLESIRSRAFQLLSGLNLVSKVRLVGVRVSGLEKTQQVEL
jgi:DNA polymerase-4